MKTLIRQLAVFGLSVVASGAVYAGAINPTPPANYTGMNTDGELGGGTAVSQDGKVNELPSILSNYYAGTSFQYPQPANITGSVYGTLTITGGSLGTNVVKLVRQYDSGGSGGFEYLDGTNSQTLTNPTGGGNDSVWHDGTANFRVDALIAANGQSFGYINENTDATTSIFSKAGVGLTSGPVTIGNVPFAWYDSSGGNTFYSDSSLNSSSGTPGNNLGSANTNEDHMVTYEVFLNGSSYTAGTSATWLLCFEDSPFATSDQDYQDLIVQVSAVPTVPVPAAAWMGLVTLAGLVGAMALRRRAQLA